MKKHALSLLSDEEKKQIKEWNISGNNFQDLIEEIKNNKSQDFSYDEVRKSIIDEKHSDIAICKTYMVQDEPWCVVIDSYGYADVLPMFEEKIVKPVGNGAKINMSKEMLGQRIKIIF